MLIFDQFNKDDPQLRVVSLVILSGLGVLLAGLWWVQVVSARDYQANLENTSLFAPSAFRRCEEGSWTVTAKCWQRTGPPTM